MEGKNVQVLYADESHTKYAERICQLIYESALQRGTGIARRKPEYIAQKMESGKGVIALDGDKCVGFSYIECWSHGDYVATSGLIVAPDYRRMGLATRIKEKTFQLARERFPYAKLFSITTSLAVMKLNTRLGYQPVTLSELTHDQEFWQGCEGCVNYDVLKRNNYRICLCYGMLYDPKEQHQVKNPWYTPYVMAMRNAAKKIFRLK
ncbi:MAG: GNAT family N-acetyltransferase [Bacteroidaceae bacterium]|nr:GNAT family N-acetyltransferase [Bacteroidaceae bacterium]